MAAELISGRRARMTRTTSESDVYVEMDLDGTGRAEISTTVPFYDHMLTALSRHSQIDLTVRATGDTHIDVHHTVEDVAITLGEVLKTALGDKSGIRRFGEASVPLDEALARAVVDVSGRPYLVHEGEPEGQQYHLIGGHFTGSLVRHVFEAITVNGVRVHLEDGSWVLVRASSNKPELVVVVESMRSEDDMRDLFRKEVKPRLAAYPEIGAFNQEI